MNATTDSTSVEIVKLAATELAAIQGGNGSCIDPNGNPLPPNTGSGDDGCGIDPFG